MFWRKSSINPIKRDVRNNIEFMRCIGRMSVSNECPMESSLDDILIILFSLTLCGEKSITFGPKGVCECVLHRVGGVRG
jgi:hypothetical protein